MWEFSNGFIKTSSAELFDNPVIGGVTIETPKVKPHPQGQGGGHLGTLSRGILASPADWAIASIPM